MLRIAQLFLIFSLFPIYSAAQEKISSKHYLGAQLGVSQFTGLESLNKELKKHSNEGIQELGFAWGLQYSIQKSKQEYAIILKGQSLNNTANSPNTKFGINAFSLSFQFGQDLSRDNEHWSTVPYIGIGVSSLELFVKREDSTVHLAAVSNGAQNLYYERSSLGLLMDIGGRVSWQKDKLNSRFKSFIELNYQYQVNEYRWDLDEFPLNSMNQFQVTGGILYQFSGKQF